MYYSSDVDPWSIDSLGIICALHIMRLGPYYTGLVMLL